MLWITSNKFPPIEWFVSYCLSLYWGFECKEMWFVLTFIFFFCKIQNCLFDEYNQQELLVIIHMLLFFSLHVLQNVICSTHEWSHWYSCTIRLWSAPHIEPWVLPHWSHNDKVHTLTVHIEADIHLWGMYLYDSSLWLLTRPTVLNRSVSFVFPSSQPSHCWSSWGMVLIDSRLAMNMIKVTLSLIGENMSCTDLALSVMNMCTIWGWLTLSLQGWSC